MQRFRQALGRGLGACWRYVRRAPGTFCWLILLLPTTIIMSRLEPSELHHVLIERSTNLHHLAEDPLHVLVASAFWPDGGSWLTYLVLFNLFHVPAERWLGTLRWLGLVVLAHIGATYASEGAVYLAIHHGSTPASAADALDVGVSYALAGVAGVLTYRLGGPVRYVYLAALVTAVALPFAIDGVDFTEIGHGTAVLIGLAYYPLTRSRGGPWDPIVALRTRRARRRVRIGTSE
ncbi:rhomboid-like protein [Aldersonia kunmingensis]|uniref:rhomboid-like protein n=1 Tax=Aldersonia kunmingensis TaxID=408066 RepID=UPI000A077435|nr:rhomboid-like protein [Aldersonia kunmingensis]